MKKNYFTLLTFCFFCFANAQINIPDVNFKNKLLQANTTNAIAKNAAGNYFKIDANNNGQIETVEALQVADLYIRSSNISNLTGIESFTNLKILNCSSNQLTSFNISNNAVLNLLFCDNNQLTSLNISNNTALTSLNCSLNQLTNLNISNNTALTSLDCSLNQLTNLNISSNTALTILYCNNNQLTSLNINNNTGLTQLYCSSNPLMNLNVTNNIALTDLFCGNNQLTSLNINNNTALTTLRCDANQLTNLDLSNNIALTGLNCSANQLTNLDVSGNVALIGLYCSSNQLTNLNTSNNVALTRLYCSSNQLTNLNTNTNIALYYLYCNNNQLTSLFIKNGKNELIDFSNNPNLKYICADESQFANIQTKITTYGYTNCSTSSYCTFAPGGVSYTIQGNNKFDSNSNGCDALDIAAKNIKFSITSPVSTGTLITNNSGNYNIIIASGTHSLTPVLENPSYFTISPTSATITVPNAASPVIQNFCLTANGVYNDLEVTLLPIGPARPGFDCKYKIIYKNKGTQTQSGSVGLTFDDAVLDFVSATPNTFSQSLNNLTWNFTNLLPFESREIAITLNANSPTETPALNGGAILGFNAVVNSTNDLTPTDNVAVLNQTVVNSYDPNDKTCLQGNSITTAKIGDYVHYMIRFENTGNFAAQNVVVKDIIDATKFDIETLRPVNSSHNFITKISETNRVEFIFQNINLPFDDENNDGYIVFKIKTKSTLVLGNSFSNLANIYFDYNFPIITNTATTIVANPLATQDFEFGNNFNIYPNPAQNSLNISIKNNTQISSLSIYNTLGQLLQVITNPTQTIDVSELKTGNYFIKIISDKGYSTTKFIKE